MENENNLLKRLKRVEAPPFLYTRVLAKIEQNKEKVPRTWLTWSVLAFCTILIFNVFLVSQFSSVNRNDTQASINKSLNLKLSNQLYHE